MTIQKRENILLLMIVYHKKTSRERTPIAANSHKQQSQCEIDLRQFAVIGVHSRLIVLTIYQMIQ
ncbi:MAG: hypothetical protein B6D71_02055 [gamma proteobacterium symbiont of Stewartia floridana]|nr:MAG: hypothetical protein B6D71_02055 [gamma proteobacterium symbiont of Stewartia floridana]